MTNAMLSSSPRAIAIAPRSRASNRDVRAPFSAAPRSRRRNEQDYHSARASGSRRVSVVVAAAAADAKAAEADLPPSDWAKEWRARFDAEKVFHCDKEGACDDKENAALVDFIVAASATLADVPSRFIVVGDGGILESVRPWPKTPRFAELGAKGTCCTLASDDKTFEAHLFLSRVREVALARSERGGRKIYAIRFFGEEAAPMGTVPVPTPKTMMTVVLHGTGEGGEVTAEAVEKWESLAKVLEEKGGKL